MLLPICTHHNILSILYVCVCVYVCVRVHILRLVTVCICMYVSVLCVYVCICMYVTYARMCVCIYACMHVCVYVCMYVATTKYQGMAPLSWSRREALADILHTSGTHVHVHVIYFKHTNQSWGDRTLNGMAYIAKKSHRYQLMLTRAIKGILWCNAKLAASKI